MAISVRTLLGFAAIQFAAVQLIAGVAAAQAPVTTSFDALAKRLQIGDRVWVTDTTGREIDGTLDTLSADGLVLAAPKAVRLSAGDVARIRAREHDSIKNGTLIGLGAGAALGTAWCIGAVADDSGDIDASVECGEGFTVYPLLGTAIGWMIDSVIPGKMRLVYERPGSHDGPRASLRVRTVITPRTKGLAVSISY